MPNDLPTARTTARARYLDVLVWCGCQNQVAADLQKLVDTGHGDSPLSRLRFCCSNCGSRHTDWMVIARSAVSVQPWREAPP